VLSRATPINIFGGNVSAHNQPRYHGSDRRYQSQSEEEYSSSCSGGSINGLEALGKFNNAGVEGEPH
jgi:hypothetical protein